MSGVFFRICTVFVLSCLSVIQLQAQRVGGASNGSHPKASQSIPPKSLAQVSRMGSDHAVGAPVKTAVTPASNPAAAADTAFIGPQLPLPVVPLTPEKQAPTPPRISYQNGL